MRKLLVALLVGLAMTFPTVQTTSVGGSSTATTTPTITLPTGIRAGEKVIIFLSANEAGGVPTAITWPAGWLKPANGDADNAGSQDAAFITYRDCDGTEGASISPTLTVAANYSYACFRISGAAAGAPDNPAMATDGGATPGQPDPPANTPAGGAKDYLWITAAMWDSGLNNWSAYPANYSGGIKFDSSDNGGVALAGIAVATRQLNATTEDPGAFTLTTADQYCAATIAVSPNPTVGYVGTRRSAWNQRGPFDKCGFLTRTAYDTSPPAVTGAFTLTPDVGALQLDGLAPTIGVPVTVVPGFGQLTLSGFAPTFPTVVIPGFGQLTLSGFAPVIGVPVTVVPGFGQLTLTGLAPTFPRTIIPGFGQLVLNGLAPTFPRTIIPGFGQLVLDGFSPSFASGVTVQPGLGQLTLTGFSPTIGTPVTVVPGLGLLTLSGFSPSIGVPITVRPLLGLLQLDGFSPTITFTPLTLSLAIDRFAGTAQLVAALSSSDTAQTFVLGTVGILASNSQTSSALSSESGTSSIDSAD